MAYGLIPILSDNANIDLGDYGIRLANCEVETIRSVALHASRMDPEECRQMAARVVKRTREYYSVENFRLGFKQAVSEILVFGKTKANLK